MASGLVEMAKRLVLAIHEYQQFGVVGNNLGALWFSHGRSLL